MANQDIITALQNSIDRGESLEEAANILINSGYNPKEVQEASNYVGGGILNTMKTKPEEELAMPSQKNSFGRLKPWNKEKEASASPETDFSKYNRAASNPAQSSNQNYQPKQAAINPVPASQNPQNTQNNQIQNRQPPQQMQSNTPSQKINQGNIQTNQPYPINQENNRTAQSNSQNFMQNLGMQNRPEPQDTQQMIISQSRASETEVQDAKEIEAVEASQPQSNATKPYKKSYTKEIILLVILLLLIGLLAATIIFKNTIISWFG